MKKYSLFLVLIFASLSLAAQSLKFNPKIAYNLTYYNDDFSTEEIEGKGGWQIGVDFRAGDNLYISPGLHFIKQSERIFTRSGEVVTEPIDFEYENKAIWIPVMLGIDLLGSDGLGIRAFGGPAATIFIGEDNALETFDKLKQKDIRWGVNAGIGIDLAFISIDLQHEWGLGRVLEYFEDEATHRMFILSAGIFF